MRSEIFTFPQPLFQEILLRYKRNDLDPALFRIARGQSGVKTWNIWNDADLGFVLLYEETPVCSIWFDILRSDRGIFIWQIQGVLGKKDILAGLRWERMLLRLMIEWGRQQGAREVRVIRAERQKYWQNGDEKRRNGFYLLYNVSPRREKFSEGTDFHTLLLV